MKIDRIYYTAKALDDEMLSDFSKKKTEENEVAQLQTDHAYFSDQHAQYYQTTTRGGLMAETLESSELFSISMTSGGTLGMAEASTLDTDEMISVLGNLPNSSDFPKNEIEGNEFMQLQNVEHECFIYQNAQYYQATTRDGQMVETLESSELFSISMTSGGTLSMAEASTLDTDEMISVLGNLPNSSDFPKNKIEGNEFMQLQNVEHECFIYQNAQYYQATTRDGQMVETLESSELFSISMASGGTLSMAEDSTLDIDEIISALGNLPNSSDFPNKEIAGNEFTQLQNVELPCFINQNAQYYCQTTIEDGQMVGNNVSQIVPSCQQDKIKTDIPQVVPLGDGSEYQTISLNQADTESNNYVPCVNYDNVSNLSIYVDQDDPDVSNVYDGEDPTKKSFGVESIEVDDTSKNKMTPTKSQTVTQLHMCDYCSYASRKSYMIQRHMKVHFNMCPYKCTICNRVLKSKFSLKNHLNSHNGIKPYQCERCPSAFVTSTRLTSHVRYKHSNEKPHKCTICDHTCVELRVMERHMRIHKRKQTSRCPCCTFTSSDEFQFKQHLYIHIEDKLMYKCDVCFSKFGEKNTLKKHILLLHKEEKMEFNLFKCDHCPVICRDKNAIRNHIHRIHFSDEPIQCERCNEAFTDRYQYKIHYKSHQFEMYKCKFCPYTSRRRHYYKSHLLTHTEVKQFHCKTCNKCFRLKYSLLRHCDNNPVCIPPPEIKRTYVCNICQGSYLKQESLIRHGKVHMQSQLEMTEIKHEDNN